MAIPTVHLIYLTRYHPWFICRDDHRHIGNICNSIKPISVDGRDLRHSWSACLNRLVEPDRRRSSLSATYSVTGQKRHFGDDMAQYRTLFEGDGWPVLLSTRGRSLGLRDNQRSQGMQTDDAMIASSLAHQFVRLV
jgi:hypothetical protein